MNVLVTGATGFVGCSVLNELKSAMHLQVSAASRSFCKRSDSMQEGQVNFSRLMDDDWQLGNVDVVVHLANKAHVFYRSEEEASREYQKFNIELTERLAKNAARNGVKRFVFLSSISVYGDAAKGILTEMSAPNPTSAVGVSKLMAEKKLKEIGEQTDMEVVIIRSPLVYGPGAPGNMGKLIEAVRKGSFLPFGKAKNKRSLIALENLASFVACVVSHPNAGNQLFLVSDGEDFSLAEFLMKIGETLNRRALLIPIPVSLIFFCAKLMGKSRLVDKVFGELVIDCSKAKTLLSWSPCVSMDDQLKAID